MERPFGWIPFRVLTSGLLEQLSPPAKLLLFFLCLVADRDGVSFYGPRRITALLGLESPELVDAVEELRHADVLAFDGQVYQLLSLPSWLGQAPNRSRSTRRIGQDGEARGGPQRVGQLIGRVSGKG
jgi:hypothetical protein